MRALLASLPILLVLGLMLGARWPAARAGAAGLVAAAVLGLTLFDLRALDGPALTHMALGIGAEAAFFAAGILWILWPALALHHHQQANGALDGLRLTLTHLTPSPVLQALMLAWCLALFLEGAAGFGTPVALVAPLLVGLGIAPVTAVVLALLGHAVGVTFGALGTPATTLAAVTGLDDHAIAWRAALLNLLVGIWLMACLLRALRRDGAMASPAAPLRHWGALALMGFLLPCAALAAWSGPVLPTLAGALAAGLVMALAMRRGMAVSASTRIATPRMPWWQSLAPYGVLLVLVLGTRGVPEATDALRDWRLHWQIGERFSGQVHPGMHPGTLLLVALLVGSRAQGEPMRRVIPSLAAAARRLVPVAAALLAMLALSRLMLHAGLVDALQQGAVASVGAAWPAVAPALGALGSFVTGSATASNVLFGVLQAETAAALGQPPAWVAAAQLVGAGVGNIISPHNVVAGAATVGLAGREGEVLRRTLLPCLAALLLAGGMALLAIRLAGASG